MTNLSRRDFLELSIAGLGVLTVSPWSLALEPEAKDPHFFIQFYIGGGADGSYMFDARPLEMTKNNIMQNYTEKEPNQWIGNNGVNTWCTDIVKPLEAYKENFSILNGVMMTPTFDGHNQNLNYLMTGNSFGGESFVPHLNLVDPYPLDGMFLGTSITNATNEGSMIPLGLGSFNNLLTQVQNSLPISETDPLSQFIHSRYENLSKGSGNFSKGILNMLKAHGKSTDLYGKILKLKAITPDPTDPEGDFCKLAFQLFKSGIARSASLNIFGEYDTHAFSSAKKQPELFTDVTAKLVKIFKNLKETPFDDTRSFLDVTTVFVMSEFGRTMRSLFSSSINTTGTDHNQFTNMMLLGGKGIKGGQVIGASDFQTSDEELSKAHLAMDKSKLKIMGRPFDFETMRPRSDKPETFAITDYLTSHSVINTIYTNFGISENYHRIFERTQIKAKVLKGLLV